MTAQNIDGVKVANAVKSRVKQAVAELKKDDLVPCLATVLVGDDPASASYVTSKQKDCAEVGILTKDHRLPGNFSGNEFNSLIGLLNDDKTVHGILVQLPLPSQIDEFEAIAKISPLKDVDGLTPYNMGLLAAGRSFLKPCTPSGIIELLDFYNIQAHGKHAVIINRSNLVGKPLYHLLLEKNATVTTCHSRTSDLKFFCTQADIVVSAVGNREKFTLTDDMVKDGAVVIDVGTNRINGKLVGDADYEKVVKKASYITPVPGGVGPMTRAMLLKNTVTAASIGRGIVSHH